jgi:hypothetical protein
VDRKVASDIYRKLQKTMFMVILCPYLVNIRRLTHEDAARISNKWLQKYDRLKDRDFNSSIRIKNNLKGTNEYKPSFKRKIKR